jgi:methylase of polypeptide subunit release factors
VRAFLFRNPTLSHFDPAVLELGSGTGEAIAEILDSDNFGGFITGYELNKSAASYAQRMVLDRGISNYRVIHGDFFDALPATPVHCAISNPPYLPALDNQISMPSLWGGPDGSVVMRKLLDCEFQLLVTTLSSFANPVGTVEYAVRRGYRVADFAVRTIPFGRYSAEQKVRAQVERLALDSHQAFFTAERYCLAGVLWVKNARVNLASNLERAITSLP